MKKFFLFFSLGCFLLLGAVANATSPMSTDAEMAKPMENADVTFCVDLSCFAVADAAAVAFGFSGFAPTNFLSDPDQDGIYCGTFNVPSGNVEYKYFFAQQQFEDLSIATTGECINASGNRSINVMEGVPQTVVDGWESCDETCFVETTTDVTFCVDLSCFTVSDAVAVAFAPGFAPTNFMSDPDGDRIYCGTFGVPSGTVEFKYFFAQEQFENLTGVGDCVNAAGNRTITVEQGVPQTVTFGWESCEEECPVVNTTDVTFCVNLDCFPVADAVAVAGSFNGFSPGANFMFDPDGDKTFCTTVGVPAGEQEFKFFFAQAQFEDLAGAGACVTPGGNRSITVVDGVPQTVTFGWESCDEECQGPPEITFCVNLNCSGLNPSNVNIFGQFNGFNPVANPMQDMDGDGIYCTTIPLFPGNQEYLFLADGVAESFNVGDPCTISCCGGQFTNRLITVVDGQDQTVNFDWESCDFTCIFEPPAPWEQYPDGINCTGGSDASYEPSTETFSLESGGCAASGFNADKAAYLAYDLCGDGELIAQVTSISPQLGWAGISMRESEAAGSKKVALSTNLGNFGRREIRYTTNGFAIPQQFFRPGASWLRLVRSGNTFIGYMSSNGISWQQVLVANVNMSSCIQLGLFVTNVNGSTVTATFDNVMGTDPVIPQLSQVTTDLELNAAPELGGLEVYPNPTSTNEIYLNLGEFYGENVQVDLMDATGRQITSRQIQEVVDGAERFDLQGLETGIYFLRVTSSRGETTKKFLKLD